MYNDQDIRKIFRNAISDKGMVEKIFGSLRQSIHDQVSRFETVESVINNPTLNLIITQSKRTFNDMGTLIDIIEAVALNSVEQKDLLLQLVSVYRQSDKLKEDQLEQLRNRIQEQEKEINEFKKHKDSVEWLTNYLKRGSETSPQ